MKPWYILLATTVILIGAGACYPVPTDTPTAPAGSPLPPTAVPSAAPTWTPLSFPFPFIFPSPIPQTTIQSLPVLLPTAGSPPPYATPTYPPAGPAAFRTLAPTPSVTPPAPNASYPLLTVRVQGIQVGDDDGGRAARITPQQLKRWIDKANEVYARASIRLLYDPDADIAAVRSTLLNNMAGDGDANWAMEVAGGNGVAAQYPDKLVVLFIHGPGQGAAGGGFSSSNYNFAVMPGFDDTSVCGYQNIGALAHELGHYFGLSHTFARSFAGVDTAGAYLSAHGNDPKVFDGDGLSDTPPDPFIAAPQFQCNPKDSITLNGRVLPLPRLNIMSYYSTTGVDRNDLTPQQIAIARWVLTVRANNHMATPTNLNAVGATLFATVPIKDPAGVNCGVQGMASFGDTPRWSGDRQLFCSAQLNSTLGFAVSARAAGRYTVNLYATTAPDYGILQTLVDGNPLGPLVDLYSPIIMPSGRLNMGLIDLAGGVHTLGFRVVGKNGSSSNYSLGLNAFALTPGG